MKVILRSVAAGMLAVALTASAAFAQERPAFRQEELEQMLAPIALYPDSLLSQVLMAATYPLEVVQAARWSRANSRLQGQDAARAVEQMDWDPSVKSLVAFPQVLHRMDEQLDWTQRLGEAFIVQEPQVMEIIQGLRQRAEAAGNLRSGEQMRVVRQGENILIEPPSPQVVYVPYYDPAVVYGPWAWPAYPPVYWGPPVGYYAGYWPGFFWGTGIVISTGYFFGHADWHHGFVKVVPPMHRHPVHAHGRSMAHHAPAPSGASPVRWQHDPAHRRGVAYRYAGARQPTGQPPATRGNEGSRPVTVNERGAPQESRNVAPQTRSLPAAPRPRSESSDRVAPQPANRSPVRGARMEDQHLASRASEPRPAAVTPSSGATPRPVAPATVARSDLRPHAPAERARAAPQRESESAPRAELRGAIRQHFTTPRAEAGASMQAPRATGGHASAGARAHGGGSQRATPAGRGGGRS